MCFVLQPHSTYCFTMPLPPCYCFDLPEFQTKRYPHGLLCWLWLWPGRPEDRMKTSVRSHCIFNGCLPFRHPRTHVWCWRKTYHHEQIWSLLSKIVVLKKGREGRRDDASTEREIDWLCATVPLVQFDVLCAKKNEFRTPVPRFQVTSSSISAWMSAP